MKETRHQVNRLLKNYSAEASYKESYPAEASYIRNSEMILSLINSMQELGQ
jgi:hypothetical protein